MIKLFSKKAVLFLALVFSINAILTLLYFFAIDRTIPGYSTLFMFLYVLIPGLAALVIQVFWKDYTLQSYFALYKPDFKWFLPAWLLPIAVAIVSILIAWLFPSVSFSNDMDALFEILLKNLTQEDVAKIRESFVKMPVHPFLLLMVFSAAVGVSINAFVALSEELAWRGLLYRELQTNDKMTLSLIIGIFWGIWNVPLILMGHYYPENPVVGLFMMLIFCVVWSIIFTFYLEKSGSIFTSAVMHGTLNSSIPLSYMMLKGGNDVLIGLLGLSGIGAVLLAMGLVMDINERLPDGEAVYEK